MTPEEQAIALKQLDIAKAAGEVVATAVGALTAKVTAVKGETGPVGPQGPQGPKGDKGDKGDVGSMGLDGIQGPRGDMGFPGPVGPAGEKGERGADGRPGADSKVPGPQGEPGPKGDQGPAGADGTPGAILPGGRGAGGLQLQANGEKLRAQTLDLQGPGVSVETVGKTAVATFSGTGSGSGLPPGGIAPQVLTKLSGADGDAGWEDPAGGGSFASGSGAPTAGADQSYYLEGNSNPLTGNTYKVTFRTQTTPDISVDLVVEDVVPILEALSSIGPGNIGVHAGDEGVSLVADGYLRFDFTGTLGLQAVEAPTISDDTSGVGLLWDGPGGGVSPTTGTGTNGAHWLDADSGLEYAYLTGDSAWHRLGLPSQWSVSPHGGLTIAPDIAGENALTLLAAGPRTDLDDLLVIGNSDNASQSKLDSGGEFETSTSEWAVFQAAGVGIWGGNTAPDDSKLIGLRLALWFDATNGSPALKIKAKQDDGTIVTATIPLTA